MTEDASDRVATAYGTAYSRLVELKKHYDSEYWFPSQLGGAENP
jgi:hypothetical protein